MPRAYDSDSDSVASVVSKKEESSIFETSVRDAREPSPKAETRQGAPQPIRGSGTPTPTPIDRTTRAESGKKPDYLRAAGFDSPEDFTIWWDGIVAGHPNRSKNAVARSRIMEQILAGTFQLYEIVEGELWKYEPVPLKKTDQERGLAG